MEENMILEKLKGVKQRFIEIGEHQTKPDVLSDMDRHVTASYTHPTMPPKRIVKITGLAAGLSTKTQIHMMTKMVE